MARDLILGTAGHIDHGKTSLVKALTGVDCDRLPEEKARGITIDIGFARLDLPPHHLGIIDVPGHERFIKNMLAGATGIDLVVLVIAADDSVMPQTREHLDILRLLGIQHGLIALTKTDLVDATSREVVELEIRELVEGTFLEKAPIIPTSAYTGEGLESLKAAIRELCCSIQKRSHHQWFRLGIDRSFVIQGHGTVVTGSVVSGSLKVGEEIEWLPGREKVRVRSLQNHDQSVEEVHQGQRAAVNLAGVRQEEIERGQEIATSGYLVPSTLITVRLHCLPGMRRAIKHRLPLRLHAGTAERLAKVSLLDCDQLEPGKWALAQLFLDEPVTVVWGQPFVLRDSSATMTLGGGQILQPQANKIRRRHYELLERIEQVGSSDPHKRTLAVAWFANYGGFSRADLVRDAGLDPLQLDDLLTGLKEKKLLVEITISPTRKLVLHQEVIEDLEGRLLQHLAAAHTASPLVSSHDRQKIQSHLDYIGDPALVNSLVEGLLKRKVLIGDQRRIARADFKPKLSNNQKRIKETLVNRYREAGFQPPDPNSFSGLSGGNTQMVEDLIEVCIAEGQLVRVGPSFFLHGDVEADLRQRIRSHLGPNNLGMTVAEIRDLLATTRKYAVPLCEYLDQVGLTRRDGDLRYLQTQTPETDVISHAI